MTPATARPRPRRAREQESRLALLVLFGISTVFVLWPWLDLRVSGWFLAHDGGFVGNRILVVRWMYEVVPWIGRLVALVGLLLVWLAWRRPGRLGVRWWRRSMVVSLGLALVVGALVNGLLKEGWGRARPVTVQQFGGSASFTPAWQVARQCPSNCSFVSGHAATGFAVLMVGALGSLRTRRRWLLAGLACGLVVGLGRVAQGGHFASDVLIAGALTWSASCAIRWGWLLVRMRLRRRLAAQAALALSS